MSIDLKAGTPQRLAGFNSPAPVRARLQAQLYTNRKRRLARIAASASSPTPDWGAWTGASDGAVKQLFTTSGLTRGQDIAAVDDNEAVIVWRDGVSLGEPTKAVVLDVGEDGQFKAETTNTEITLTDDIAIGMNLIRVTPTRFLAVYEGTDAGSFASIALISKSGKTLVMEDSVSTIAGITTPRFQCSATRLNDTQVAVVFADQGGDTKGRTFIVDITGDAITIGAIKSVGTISQYPAIIGLTDSTFAVATTKRFSGTAGSEINYCTVSGTTVTVVDSVAVNGTVEYRDMMLGRIDDTTVVLSYEDAAIDVKARTFNWNGSSFVAGTQVTDIFDGNNIFQGTGTVTDLGDRRVMFSGRMEDETPRYGGVVILTVDESNVITKGTMTQISSNNECDHNVIDQTPSGLYVFYASQNENTVPDQQMDTRILVGF